MIKKYFCVLIVILTVLTAFSGCASVKTLEIVPGTTYVSTERIYTNPWHNSWFSPMDGEFIIEEKALRWISSYGEEKTFPVEEWKWEEFPYSEEEWSALFANPEDLFDLEPFGKILYQPIDDFKFMLLANGDLWFVGLSFLNTGNDCPLVLCSIDKLVPFE